MNLKSAALMIASATFMVGCDWQQLQQLPSRAERQIEQAAPAAADALLTAKVKFALVVAPDVSGLSIDVDSDGAVVTLSGTVASVEERERAGQAVRSVEGVRDVRNNVSVERR